MSTTNSPAINPSVESPTPWAGVSRRGFISAAALAMAASMDPARALGLGAIAGPFRADDFTDDFPIPADKKLDPAWLRSLTERGTPMLATAARDELKHIGMPVGGICTGQLYLGGDGKLWHWDLFNQPPADDFRSSAGPHYAAPPPARSPIEQGFAINVSTPEGRDLGTRTLDADGYKDASFQGQYPIARVSYRDPALPVSVELEAFSPFIPLNEDDSGLPATILFYTVKNESSTAVRVELAGWLQNACSVATGTPGRGERHNRITRAANATILDCSATAAPKDEKKTARPDILFDDFESGTYDHWTATGTAFGDRPRRLDDIATYQGNVNAHGQGTVNTHESRHGENVVQADAHIGTLTSKAFTIERDHIAFRIGGGKHPGQTCINLLVDGAPVRTATGSDNNRMRLDHFDVRELAGKQAQLQIVDGWTGGWGQIAIDEIIFTDAPAEEQIKLEEQPDWGTMALTLLTHGDDVVGTPSLAAQPISHSIFTNPGTEHAAAPFGTPLIGGLRQGRDLAAGESTTFTFILAWHFDGLWHDSLNYLTDAAKLRRHYGTRFKDARAVTQYVVENFDRLANTTRVWRDTWYDSTLPYWLLDRTFATVSTLATATCYRFNTGRFYGWEGTYCCAGTCQHVWQYAQGVARTFPNLERWVRDNVDFGLAFHDDTGAIDYRAEADRRVAHDGQAGTIVRAYREHQMSPDSAFLKKRWPRIKKAIEHLMREDANGDGILEGPQYNTLDTTWYGAISWISSLYLAAVRAGAAMATEMNDDAFAASCNAIAQSGSRVMVEKLFNGEYFIQHPDPEHPEANSTGTGCHTDQLLGQSMAHQLGLGRIIPEKEAKSALASLWKYCFAPDIAPYRQKMDPLFKGARWYAMPGEGGLLMCTWPKGGSESAAGKGGDAWAAGYFNECWTGYEHQAAAHMINEGLVQEGLAVTRMVHDRHHPAKRNPYNEVECSDHYARAMAGYGVFTAACGFEYHGPKGHIGFAPRLTPDNFRAPFIAAEGWGTFSQSLDKANADSNTLRAKVAVKHGTLRLRTIALAVTPNNRPRTVELRAENRPIASKFTVEGSRLLITLSADTTIHKDNTLEITVS